MSALLRRCCTRLDTFYERHPLFAILAAIVVCFACEVAIASMGGDAMPPVINHIGSFA